MLSEEDRQAARQLAEGVSSTLSDRERAGISQAAHFFIDHLREMGCSDEAACGVARSVCRLLGAIQAAPLQHASDMVDSNMSAYALVAGALAGVYTLPEREGGARHDPEAEQAFPGEAGNAGVGMYL